MYYDDDSEEEFDFGDSSTSESQPKVEEPRLPSVARATRPSDLPEGEGAHPSPKVKAQEPGWGRGRNRSQLTSKHTSKRLQNGEVLRTAIARGNVEEVERILEEG